MNMASLHSTLRRFRDERSGQAIVEFALILPVILVLVFGMIEFGRAWNIQQAITDAAREGARKAVVAELPPASVKPDSVYARVSLALASAGITWDGTQRNACPMSGTPSTQAWICVQNAGGAPSSNARVDVWVPYTFPVVGRLLNWATNQQTITIRTSFIMRNE